MDILLLCAGAADKAWPGPEAERPLRTKGKRQAQKIGAALGRKDLRPDRVLTSPDERSRVSAEKAVKAAGWTARRIETVSDPLALLPTLSKDRQRQLVCLPPEACASLADRLGLEIKTRSGTLFHLCGTLEAPRVVAGIDARDLPGRFPYPAPDGPERRARPAYYYRQSAVLPYRRTGEGLQILIIRSSSGRHWVVPKGIVEPGLSPAASAQKEAREEAGVEGRVARKPLGSFSYEKWGAPCEVTVFAMEIETVLDASLWAESHRTRQWVRAQDAGQRLHEPAYQDMIKRL